MHSKRSNAASCAFHGAVVILLLAGCKDATAPTPTGIVRITVSTLGGDIDDSYEFTLGAKTHAFAGPPGVSTATVTGVESGTHSVELKQVAANCSVEGNNPRSIDVQPNTVADVMFVVSCDLTGIAITTVTSAPYRPVLGYELTSGSRSVRAPGNGQVFFTRLPPGRHTLAVSNIADGCSIAGGMSRDVEVTNRAVTDIVLDIACSPSDKRIAYVIDSLASFRNWQVIIVAPTNGRGVPARIAEGRDPAWSPDRTRLVYTTTVCDYYYSSGCTGGLVIRNLLTGAETMPEYGRGAIRPAWSPDGRYLAFVRNQIAFPKLVVAEIDGSAMELDMLGLQSALHPSWSPDSQRLVFQCAIAREVADICTAAKNGTDLRFLTNGVPHEYVPTWSPDGRRIMFSTFEPSTSPLIKIMNVDGTNVADLTVGSEPAWSPDGSKIVFARGDGLYTIDSNGTNLTKITSGQHRAPTWPP